MKNKYFLVFILYFVFLPNRSLADNIVIAVRAHTGTEEATTQWQPTINYLQQLLPEHHFSLLPLEGIKEMEDKVAENQVDFIITQPVAYVDLERKYHVTRLLTLEKKYGTQFGSVIFTNSNRNDINVLGDIKNKSIVGVTQKGFGGWLIAYDELLNNGIDPYKDCQSVNFLGLHGRVIEAVVNGRAEVGIVRTGIIEKMSSNKKLDLESIKILNLQNNPDFPLLLSTQLYPEWALAKTKRIKASIAKEVTIALLNIQENHIAAQEGHYQQWVTPLTYQPVHDLMMKYRVGSYSQYDQTSFTEFLLKYIYEIIIFCSLFIIAVFSILKFSLLKKSKQELANEQERLLVTLGSIGDGVISTDLDGKIVLINKISEQLTGWSRQEAFGTPVQKVFNIINKLTGKPCDNPVDKVLSSGKIVGLADHVALVARDGSQYLIEDSGAPILDTAGKIIGVVLVFRDVTERNEAEEEKEKLEQQLHQAQKMEVIGQLTGGIAHDFNNILASILGFTGLAQQRFVGDDQPELREYLDEVTHAGERARDLVNQLLAFSRTSNSKVSQLPLPPMIKEVTRLLQATLPSSIQLSSQIDADVPPVMMDPVQLQQVLMNMCINARDAIGDKGRINIHVRCVQVINNDQYTTQTAPKGVLVHNICDACHKEIEEGDYVELSVQDTGVGISSDSLKRIFEPFFTTKDMGKGTGMGLSMVHGIIHQHGGHILMNTHPGIGTTFRLLLPVGEDELIHKTDIKLEADVIAEGLNDARILIVDDEESIARFIGDLLESHGGKVTVMTDSQAALDVFSQQPTAFDLIITDQTMPKLTGVELAQKALAQRPELPVILCTGYSDQVDGEKASALGIRYYITKPMEIKTLYNMVVQSLMV